MYACSPYHPCPFLAPRHGRHANASFDSCPVDPARPWTWAGQHCVRHANAQVAPASSAHIQKLAKLGAYNTVNFFRVDKGFVAQVTDIRGNRLVPLNEEQEVSINVVQPVACRRPT